MKLDIESVYTNEHAQPAYPVQDTVAFAELVGAPELVADAPEAHALPSLPGWGLLTKRAFDILIAALALIVLLPLFAVIAIAIRLDSAGPVVFKQVRVGKGGRTFVFYKFRTMVRNAEQQKEGLMRLNEASGPLFKMRNDPRVTRVGAWLRKTSLDELLQLVNVLKGDMSLVGPRPPLPDEVAQYNATEIRRLAVVPGITGLWQVSGRSDASFDEMMRYDLSYISSWSFLLDLKILVLTIPAVLSGRGAY